MKPIKLAGGAAIYRGPTDDRLERELAIAERKAIDALARYKFWMFGYHAAQWVMLNRLDGGKRPNPFKHLVEAARKGPYDD